jgi:hypothetical protein
MDKTIIESGNIATIGYDHDTKTLEVECSDGKLCKYLSVPEVVYHEFIDSPSKNKFLKNHIAHVFAMTHKS